MTKSHVHAPTSIIFLCGGNPDLGKTPIPSLRAAFLHVYSSTSIGQHQVITAEEAIDHYNLNIFYKDLMKFEADFAEIAKLVVLFCESEGSIAELGPFVISPTISSRLLVVIDDKHGAEYNFITLGPLKRLRNEHGQTSVMTMNTQYINVDNIKRLESLNIANFKISIEAAITQRMNEVSPPRTFDPTRNGHVILLIVALLQHYGALSFDEIIVYLATLDVIRTDEEIRGLILCGQLADWVKVNDFNFETYYTSRVDLRTIAFSFKKDVEVPRRDRWQADILNLWREKEPFRFSFITSSGASTR